MDDEINFVPRDHHFVIYMNQNWYHRKYQNTEQEQCYLSNFCSSVCVCVCVYLCTHRYKNHDTNQLYMDHTQHPHEVTSRVICCTRSRAGNRFKFESCWYILENNTLLVATFANIFFHSIGFIFSFIYGFLWAANSFQFNQVPFIFAFISKTLGDRSKNILL